MICMESEKYLRLIDFFYNLSVLQRGIDQKITLQILQFLGLSITLALWLRKDLI